MANWFAVYETSTGKLVSVGTVVANPLPSGLSTTALGVTPPSGVWNVLTHVFDAAPALKAVLSRKDFWLRFTQAERETLQGLVATGTQVQKNKLNAFLAYLGNDPVDLNDAYVQASVNLMESAGVIGVGRAAVILG